MKPKAAREQSRKFSQNAFLLFVLWLLVMASGLSIIYTTQTSRELQHELETARRQTNELHIEWSKLLLEYNTWAEYSHVETEASDKLQMQVPSAEKIIVVGR